MFHHAAQGENCGGIQATGKRLIQNENRGLGDEHAADRKLFLLPIGIGADRRLSFVGKLEQIQEPRNMIDQPIGIEVVKFSDGHQPFASGLELRQPGLIWQKGHLPSDLELSRFARAAAKAVDFDIATRRRHQAGDNAQERALSHPIRSHDRHQLASRHFQIHVTQNRPNPVMVAYIDNSDHRAPFMIQPLRDIATRSPETVTVRKRTNWILRVSFRNVKRTFQ
ncbi:hypothetical protein SBV1_450022 [Verrucomicrobia bacterium]|nr:hypothetical protein SBV1_450022 [Verrucomicrobiota bacterium]